MPTDETERDSVSEDDRIRGLRESIRRFFPAQPYKGKVTDHDGEFPDHFDEETAILDDEKELYESEKSHFDWTNFRGAGQTVITKISSIPMLSNSRLQNVLHPV